MQDAVIAATIAGSVASIGWLATYALTASANLRSLKQAAALRHIEKQLEELYGPLAFLVLEGEQTFKELTQVLGREDIFDEDDHISEADLKTWLFWAECDFLPRNEKIKELLSQKTHLLFNSKMADSYLEFLNHHNSWMIRHLRWKEQKIDYSWHSATNWPAEFVGDVLHAYESLQEQHTELLAKIKPRKQPIAKAAKQLSRPNGVRRR
jgi:hypothetical protein